MGGSDTSKFKAGLRKAALDAKIANGQENIGNLRRFAKPKKEQSDAAFLSVQCGICRNLPSGEGDPVMPSGCDHIFCSQCVVPYLQKHKKCPVCHEEAAVFPRFDGPILTVLRDLTFEMAGADLSTHLERGADCDAVHTNCGSNAAERDNPPLIRPGVEPFSKPQKKDVPRVVARGGVPSPSTAFLGWGSLPANPAPLVDPHQEFEEGCTVLSPCGKLVSKAKKGGWATKTAKELEIEKKEARRAAKMQWTESPTSPFEGMNSSATVWTKATGDQWERAWVAARMTEDRARLRKAEVARQKLQAKCRTPWRSKRDKAAGYKPDAQREVKVKRQPGSPPWHSRGVTPSVFVIKPPKPPPSPFTTPPHLDSILKEEFPQPRGSDVTWEDDALVPGGQEAPDRPQTAPPELWRREIFDGRDGPPRLDLEEAGWAPGGLLSDYEWPTTGSAQLLSGLGKTKSSRAGTPWTEITTMSSIMSRSEAPTRSPTPFTMLTSPSVLSTTPKRHHSHGLREGCSHKKCTSKKTLYGPVGFMVPMPRAKIPSRVAGAISGNKDAVLPATPNILKDKKVSSRCDHRQYMVHGVTPKPASPQTSPRADYQSNVDMFERTLSRMELRDEDSDDEE